MFLLSFSFGCFGRCVKTFFFGFLDLVWEAVGGKAGGGRFGLVSSVGSSGEIKSEIRISWRSEGFGGSCTWILARWRSGKDSFSCCRSGVPIFVALKSNNLP